MRRVKITKYAIIALAVSVILIGACQIEQSEPEQESLCITIDEAIENYREYSANEQGLPVEAIEVIAKIDLGCDDYECLYYVVFRRPDGATLEMMFYHPIDDPCFWYHYII